MNAGAGCSSPLRRLAVQALFTVIDRAVAAAPAIYAPHRRAARADASLRCARALARAKRFPAARDCARSAIGESPWRASAYAHWAAMAAAGAIRHDVGPSTNLDPDAIPGPSSGTRTGVAVLIPCYNAQAKLDRTLASLREESREISVVIVDDGSEPPLDVAPDAVGDRTVVLLRQTTNRGIAAALNLGLEHILADGRAPYIARLDAGDLCHPQRLARQARLLDEQPRTLLVGAHVDFVADDGTLAFRFRPPAEFAAIRRQMHRNSAFSHTAVMFRAEAIRRLGTYSERHPCAEDYELFWRFLVAGTCVNLPLALVRAEYDPEGLSFGPRWRPLQLASRLRIQCTYFDPLVVEAWIGLAQTLALIVLPRPLLICLKRAMQGGERMAGVTSMRWDAP